MLVLKAMASWFRVARALSVGRAFGCEARTCALGSFDVFTSALWLVRSTAERLLVTLFDWPEANMAAFDMVGLLFPGVLRLGFLTCSGFVLAKISVASRPELFVFIIKIYIYWIRVERLDANMAALDVVGFRFPGAFRLAFLSCSE